MYNQHSTNFIYFLFKAIRPFYKWIIAQLIISIIWAINLSLSPLLVKIMLDNISNIEYSKAFEVLWKPAFFYISISAFIFIVLRIYDWIALTVNPNLKKHICLMLIQMMMKHAHSFYQNNFAGSLTNKVDNIFEGTITIIRLLMDQFFCHILGLVIAVCTIWKAVGIKFALALIIWMVLFIIISWKLSLTAKKLSGQAAEIKSGLIGHIVDIFSNMLNVRLFSSEISEITNLNSVFQNFVYAMQKRDWFFLKIYFVQGSLFIIFQAICLWWLILGFKNQTVTSGDFALILMLNLSIVDCLLALSHNLGTLTESFGNITQGLQTIYSPLEIEDNPSDKKLRVTKGIIIFDNVEFNYKDSLPIFKQKSVIIKSKEKVGLVGYSGSGKSTFINLILRLFDVSKGRILIDNQNICDVTQTSLRKVITMIPQDPILFHRSIMENIRYSKSDARDEEVIEAAKRAYAHDFITALPNGYQSLTGERGIKLSGGERQRIIIARAILKNAPILILDEATSQLDSITEHQIQESLENLMQNKTTIVIAHRLSTLLQMDRILVFDQGKIVQDGEHDKLIKINGLYKTLWNTQIGGFMSDNINTKCLSL